MGLAGQDAKDVYYLALLRFIGCNAHAQSDASMIGGNEMTFRRGMATVISGSQGDVMSHVVRHLGEGLPITNRVRLVAGAFAAGPKQARETIAAACEVARIIATRLGLGPSLIRALGYAGEYWNGKGMPDGVSGNSW